MFFHAKKYRLFCMEKNIFQTILDSSGSPTRDPSRPSLAKSSPKMHSKLSFSVNLEAWCQSERSRVRVHRRDLVGVCRVRRDVARIRHQPTELALRGSPWGTAISRSDLNSPYPSGCWRVEPFRRSLPVPGEVLTSPNLSAGPCGDRRSERRYAPRRLQKAGENA